MTQRLIFAAFDYVFIAFAIAGVALQIAAWHPDTPLSYQVDAAILTAAFFGISGRFNSGGEA